MVTVHATNILLQFDTIVSNHLTYSSKATRCSIAPYMSRNIIFQCSIWSFSRFIWKFHSLRVIAIGSNLVNTIAQIRSTSVCDKHLFQTKHLLQFITWNRRTAMMQSKNMARNFFRSVYNVFEHKTWSKLFLTTLNNEMFGLFQSSILTRPSILCNIEPN